MFERTVSFWRRLLHPWSADAGTAVLDEERRRGARWPANGAIRYQLASAAQPEGGTAWLRNISLGGINLVVDRDLTPGDLLNLELGGDGPSRSVLACVVHTAPDEDDQWSLGCTFARDLTADDLLPFTDQAENGALVEQRVNPRFTCAIEASYQRVGEPDEEDRSAGVLNISTTGVGLLVREPLNPGTLLSITLGSAHQGETQTILSCVVHMTAQQDGEWALGCNFITELREESLKHLL